MSVREDTEPEELLDDDELLEYDELPEDDPFGDEPLEDELLDDELLLDELPELRVSSDPPQATKVNNV